MSGVKSQVSKNIPIKFVEYMNESLRLEAVKLKIEGGGSISNKEEKDIKYNVDGKSRILRSYVIKSIANLTYFFEFLNNHPELIDKFGKDIEKMFGLNMPLDSKKAPFTRMLMELVGEGVSEAEVENLSGYLAMDSKFNFRIRLLNMMQYVIRLKANWVSMNLNTRNFKDPPTRNDYEMSSMLMSDLKRAQIWMGYLNQSVTNVPDREKKTRLNAKTIIPKSKYTKELDEKVRQEFRRKKKT